MRELITIATECNDSHRHDDTIIRVTAGEIRYWQRAREDLMCYVDLETGRANEHRGKWQNEVAASLSLAEAIGVGEKEIDGLRACLRIERHELAHATEQVKHLESEVSRLRNLMHSMWTSTHTHAAEMERLNNAMNNE